MPSPLSSRKAAFNADNLKKGICYGKYRLYKKQPAFATRQQVCGVVHLATKDRGKSKTNLGQIDSTSMGGSVACQCDDTWYTRIGIRAYAYNLIFSLTPMQPKNYKKLDRIGKRFLVRKMFMLMCITAIAVLVACQPGEKVKDKGLVVLSPEVAEIVCALGAEAEIVGITAECNFPPSLAAKQKVGSFSSIDREAIIKLKPKLIFCSALEQEGMAAELSKLGYKVEVVYPKSLISLKESISRIGALIDRKQEAIKLNEQMDESIRQIKLKAGVANSDLPQPIRKSVSHGVANSDLPQPIRKSASLQTKPVVYLEIYRNPLMSVSDKSFVGELIETAGGDNAFATLERDYSRVNPETVIAAEPDIMICYSQDTLQSILARKGWQEIPAIKNRQIYFETDINPDLLQRATPRCIEGMQKLQAIYAKWQADSEK